MREINKIKKAANFIKNKFKKDHFDIAVIFGSGLSPDIDFDKNQMIQYKDIPFFPVSSIKGHKNRLVFKEINNKNLLFFMGRVHLYEGFTPCAVTFPIRVVKELNVKYLVLTNASGALKNSYKTGEIVIIKDQINFTGHNPLIGENINEHGPRFVSMNNCYDNELIKIAKSYKKPPLNEAIYIGVTGPNYETEAEVNFFKTIGADIVGMSTVLEAITAKHCSLKTLGISCITNVYDNKSEPEHREVVDIANKAKIELTNIVNFLTERLV